MSSSRSVSAATGHGVGVIWWPELDPLCRPSEGLVTVIEVEPETFWIPRGVKPSGFTSRLPNRLEHLPQPKLLHGVGAPFGGNTMQSAWHRETLASDIAALRPKWISDHLNFNQFMPAGSSGSDQAACTGFFLPPAQCSDGVKIAAEQIRLRRATAGVPVAFEVPVSYLPKWPGEMPDGVFAAEIAEAADCGILLDLHNLLCNERNGRQSVAEFCRSIPLERVWEIHLAGGEPAGRYWLDAHCGLVERALMEILVDIVPRLPALQAIIFELGADYIGTVGLRPIGELLGQLNDAWATRAQVAAQAHDRSAIVGTGGMAVTSTMWESALGAAVAGTAAPDLPAEFADWVGAADEQLGLYRTLAGETRASSLVESTPRTIRSLLRHSGEARTRELLGRFWRHATPAYTIVEDAWCFLDFVSDAGVSMPGLAADIASDRSLLCQTVNAASLCTTSEASA
jgi:uncharacterized protein (UPF0276 family)